MNIISITLNTIKLNLKSKAAFFLEILFPIVLIFVFGTVLNGAMNSSKNFKDIKVVYCVSETSNTLFKELQNEGSKLGIDFVKKDKTSGIKAVENGKYTCLIEMKNNKINLYKNSNNEFKAELIEAFIKTFLNRYNAMQKILIVNPMGLKNLSLSGSDKSFLKDISISGKGNPGALDYYAVTMLTYILMYCIINGMNSIGGHTSTMNRLICSPVKKSEILIGRIMGATVFSVMQILIIIFFSKFAFNAYWGQHIGSVFLIALAESIMAISIGMGVTFIFKDKEAISTGLNVVVMMFGFLGGCFFKLSNMGKIAELASNISPINLINNAIFKVIYANDFSLMPVSIAVCLIIAAVFIVVTTFSYGKEAF